jgi:hypothetical protein
MEVNIKLEEFLKNMLSKVYLKTLDTEGLKVFELLSYDN